MYNVAMTSSDVVFISDFQLKYAAGQTYLNVGHPIMFQDKYVGTEKQSNRNTHKKSLVFMYTGTGFGFIILTLFHTAETNICIDAYSPIVMIWLYIFSVWIFVIAA